MKFALKLPTFRSKSAAEAEMDISGTEPAYEPTGSEAILDAPRGTSLLARYFDRKQMIRVTALLIVAAAAGQVMQSFGGNADPLQVAEARQPLAEPVEAAVEAEGPAVLAAAVSPAPILTPAQAAAPAEVAMISAPANAAAILPEVPEPLAQSNAPAAEMSVLLAAADLMIAADASSPVLVAATQEPPPVDAVVELALPQPLLAEDCPVRLDLSAAPGGVIKITLTAPCAPNARVVLSHEGLAITGVTTSTGALFAAMPALTPSATVEAGFGDGSTALASLYLPEATKFRRFGVQWQGDDAFQVQAYLNGAAWGSDGHINAGRAGMAGDEGGFLQVLGDPSAPMPLLAEVYTYPMGASPVDLQVESVVTFKTCERELLAETLTVQNGTVAVSDLTLSMPDCGATGEILVLNNLAMDMTLASN